MKKWYQSKTLWANLGALVLGVLDGTYGATGIPAQWLAVAVPVLNIVLRIVTTTGIGKG